MVIGFGIGAGILLATLLATGMGGLMKLLESKYIEPGQYERKTRLMKGEHEEQRKTLGLTSSLEHKRQMQAINMQRDLATEQRGAQKEDALLGMLFQQAMQGSANMSQMSQTTQAGADQALTNYLANAPQPSITGAIRGM